MRDYAAAPLLAAHVLFERLGHQLQKRVVWLELIPGLHRSFAACSVRICLPKFLKAFWLPLRR